MELKGLFGKESEKIRNELCLIFRERERKDRERKNEEKTKLTDHQK